MSVTARPGADLEREVAALTEALADARRRNARAAAEHDAAAARATEARELLRAEFGVSSVEEATALLTRLEAELGQQVDALRAALAAMQGQP
jgi:hypothetical protein